MMLVGRFSKRYFCTAAFSNARPWLFVGLGNPGDKYTGTRHNVGFELIDAFAKSQGISMDAVHCKAIFGKGFVHGGPVFLAKPQTYMNLSGESSGPMAAYYMLPLNRVLVFHDDMGLPCGVLRLHPKGNHGSHNGVSVQSASSLFPRSTSEVDEPSSCFSFLHKLEKQRREQYGGGVFRRHCNAPVKIGLMKERKLKSKGK
ncbi:peptidyl-tRNA hydrolase, mitochondrial isoform X2 [Henckelia pumila]|uniref:peptidyl-tRNA hydrolase, mitochondrial isoform X2 n=1 Tax=Henckelia pumila TaxID=405737 RepID=UPI003C6DE72C